jgi:hypothetical protein
MREILKLGVTRELLLHSWNGKSRLSSRLIYPTLKLFQAVEITEWVGFLRWAQRMSHESRSQSLK